MSGTMPDTSMRSYQLTGYRAPLERREGPRPEPAGDEVLLAVEACGVCHSDLHLADGYFDLGDGRRLDLTGGRDLPFTLGHEIAGVVVARGPGAAGVAVGERRVVYPWIGCGGCPTCDGGDEHLCGAPRALGITRAGGFADHVLVPHARYLFDAGTVAVARAATCACSGLTAYGALRKVAARRDPVPHLLLVGLGGVGMAALGLAPSVVTADLLAADVDPARLEAARGRGAAWTVDAGAADAAKQVRRRTGGGASAAIDFVGSPQSAALALGALAPGGTLVVVGLFGGALRLSLPLLPLKQLTIRGSYVGSLAEMAELMALVRENGVPSLPIDERPLGEAQATLDDLRAGGVLGRAVLRPGAG